MVWGFEGEDSKCHLVCLPFLCFPFPIATGRFIFQNGLLRMISVLHVHGGGVEVMGWGGGRGVYMCTSVIMARAARSHQSEPGRPLLSLLLGGRGRGDAARDADVLLERPRSNCGACSICSRYVCPGVYQRQQVGPDYLIARSPSTGLRLRVCPCERVFHARVCALTAHTSLFP